MAARMGPYEEVDVLGRGGMGVVSRARHVELGVVRAVRVLPARPGADDASARFERERQALAAIRHPNVVAIHESGEHQGALWFAMDLVQGESLERVLGRGRLP